MAELTRAEAEASDDPFASVMMIGIPHSDAPFARHEHDILFGEVWKRGGVSRRERRLMSMAVLAAGAGPEKALVFHVRAAIRSGDLTEADLQEAILHLAYYAGWPAAGKVYIALRDVTTALKAEEAASPADASTTCPRPSQPTRPGPVAGDATDRG